LTADAPTVMVAVTPADEDDPAPAETVTFRCAVIVAAMPSADALPAPPTTDTLFARFARTTSCDAGMGYAVQISKRNPPAASSVVVLFGPPYLRVQDVTAVWTAYAASNV
jgi:hypothetical protein